MTGILASGRNAIANQAQDKSVPASHSYFSDVFIARIKADLGLPPQASDTAVLARLRLVDNRP